MSSWSCVFVTAVQYRVLCCQVTYSKVVLCGVSQVTYSKVVCCAVSGTVTAPQLPQDPEGDFGESPSQLAHGIIQHTFCRVNNWSCIGHWDLYTALYYFS